MLVLHRQRETPRRRLAAGERQRTRILPAGRRQGDLLHERRAVLGLQRNRRSRIERLRHGGEAFHGRQFKRPNRDRLCELVGNLRRRIRRNFGGGASACPGVPIGRASRSRRAAQIGASDRRRRKRLLPVALRRGERDDGNIAPVAPRFGFCIRQFYGKECIIQIVRTIFFDQLYDLGIGIRFL